MSTSAPTTAAHDRLKGALRRHPAARVSAVSSDGTPVEVPKQISLGVDHVLSGTAGMMAYHPDDRPILINGFEQVLHHGHSQLTARLLGETSSTSMSIEMFDVVDDYGVVMIVAVPSESNAATTTASLPTQIVLPSRLARIHKTRTAEIVDIDAGVTEILGLTAAEMVGRRSLEFLHPEDHDLAIQAWAALLSDPAAAPRTRVRHCAEDGRWVWFDVTHNRCANHEPDCFVADMIDISKEMEAQQALEAREQMLTQLARALPLGVFQVDEDRRLVYVNEGLGAVMRVGVVDDITELLRWVRSDDRHLFLTSLETTSSSEGTTEFDIHLTPPDNPELVVCHVTLRGLGPDTGSAGGAVGCVADVTEQTMLRRALEDRATFDSLTRCLNRESAMTALDASLRRPPRRHRATAVLFVDLDDFKAVNDRYGHAVGDELLVAVAATISRTVRSHDVVGRIGGDEFLVVLDEVTTQEANRAAQRLRAALADDFPLSVGRVPASASVGLARADQSISDADGLVIRADSAMYEAKRSGRAASGL
jgi:diguanylate cyclase (GGDEF)-like protein/PAS domain S-box-containing protein